MKFQTDLLPSMLFHKSRLFFGLLLALAVGPLFGNNGSNCELYDVIIDKGDCTSDSTYMLTFTFSYHEPGGDTFKLWVNGAYYGNYAYADLPITIQNFPKSGGNNDWIKVCDLVTPDCCRIKEFDTVECGSECSISEILLDLGDCTSDSTYNLFFNLIYVNNGGPMFTVYANGVEWGEYAYADLPITLNDFPKSGNNNDWIKVCDNEAPDCCKIKEFDSPDCGGGNGDCDIKELHVEAFCDGEEIFYVHLDFDVENPMADQFKVYGNGMFHGNFSYNDLPITIGPLEADCHTEWEFAVQDLELPACFAVFELGKQCCDSSECDINELAIDVGDCNSDGTYELWVNFNHQGQSDSFIVYANGAYFGKYPYQLPLVIPHFPVSGNNHDWIKICDAEHHDCCAIKEFESPECEGGSGDCEINELAVDVGDCNPDGTYELWVNFNYNQGQSDSFIVYANGAYFGKFPYQLPLVIPHFPVSGNNHDWIKICDAEHPNCCAIKEFESPECEGGPGDCQIKELEIHKECDGDSIFYVTIEFVPINPGNEGFEIKGNGINYGSFSYNDLPIVLGPLNADCHTFYEFVIQDKQFPHCKKEVGYGKVCCGEEEEQCIGELNVDPGLCTNDSVYHLTINFEVPANYDAPFEVWINGHFYGEYPLASLPLTLPEVLASNNAKEKILICLTGEQSCCHDAYYSKPECIQDFPSEFVKNDPDDDKVEQHPTTFKEGDPVLLHIWVNGNPYTMTVSDFPATDRQIRIMDITGNIWLNQDLKDNSTEETITLPYFPNNRMVIIQVLSPEKQVISRFLGKME